MKVYKLTDKELEELLDNIKNNEISEEELNENDPFIKVNKKVIENSITAIAKVIGNNIYENRNDIKAILSESDMDIILDALEELKGEIE